MHLLFNQVTVMPFSKKGKVRFIPQPPGEINAGANSISSGNFSVNGRVGIFLKGDAPILGRWKDLFYFPGFIGAKLLTALRGQPP